MKVLSLISNGVITKQRHRIQNLIWSDIEIDTVKENLYISNLDPRGAIEIESVVSNFMMKEKQKYGKKEE